MSASIAAIGCNLWLSTTLEHFRFAGVRPIC
jgi:hypothetical protein